MSFARIVVILLGVFGEENLALNQPAWAPYISPQDPPSKAVDGLSTTFGYRGALAHPFLAVDLVVSTRVGRVSFNFQFSKYDNTPIAARVNEISVAILNDVIS